MRPVTGLLAWQKYFPWAATRRPSFKIAAILLANLFWVLIFSGSVAHAGPYDPPPVPTIVDENGINLQTGEFNANGPSISIGKPGQGGLTYMFVSAQTGNWTGSYNNWDTDGIKYDPVYPNTLIVTYRNNSTTFSYFSNLTGNGATLSFDGTNYTFTTHDGTVVVFQDVSSYYRCYFIDDWCPAGFISSVTYPAGEVVTYTYLLSSGAPYEINSINSSLGYQLKFNYSCSGCVYSVSAVNNAVSYCDPNGTTCPGTWPTMYYTKTAPGAGTVTDALGNTTTNAEDSSSATITQPSGRYIKRIIGTCTDGCDLKEAVTDGSGASWDYELFYYSAYTTTTRITDPAGRVKVVVSDPTTGMVSSVTLDPSGLNLTTSYSYWIPGVLTRVTYPEGNYTEWLFDSRANVTQVNQVAKPGSGIATISTYATYDTCTSTNYRICNQPTSTTDANGNVTNYTYDANHGGVLTVTGPAVNTGHPQTSYNYSAKYAWYKNSSGNIVQAATPVYKLDSSSKCLSGSCSGTAQQQVTTIGYTAGSSSTATNLLPVSTTVAAGDNSISSTTSVSYDDYSNVVSTTGPISGSTTVFFYDLDRRVYGTVGPDPTGSGAYPAVRTSYDVDSRITQVERGTTNGQSSSNWSSFSSLTQETLGYDPYSGAKTSDTAAIGGTTQSVTQFSYNGSRLPLCTAVRENPSLFGSLPSDACTPSTSGSYGPDQISYNSYDNAFRLTSVQTGYATGSPITQVTNVYTPNGKLDYVEDANGNRTDYTYDGLDRLVQTNFPSKTSAHTASSTDYEQYGYDANDNLTSKRLRSGDTIGYGYDALNRQTLMDLPGGSSADVYTDYDLIGDLLYARYGSASGSGVSYAYDAFGRKTSETSYGRTVWSQYDAAGNRTRLTYPDGNYVQYTYDILNRMYQVKQNGSTVLAQYAYDSLDRETGITRSNSTSTSMSYGGSSANWSLSHSGTSQNVTFSMSYTPAGQVYQRTISNAAYAYGAPSLSQNYSPNGLNQYDSVGGTGYSYDGRGNLTSDGSTNYSYDVENRLVSASGARTATLSYDPNGRLAQVPGPSSPSPTVITGSVWGTDKWNIMPWAGGTWGTDKWGSMYWMQAGLSGEVQLQYDGDTLVAEYDAVSGVLLRRYVPGQTLDETLVWYEGSNLSNPNWLHTDQQGSVVATTNSSGTATAYSYSATGEPGNWSGVRLRYTGQAAIPELALYYYKARMYDPALGRFRQTDPAGYRDSLNLYTYALNDPANKSDPSGLGLMCSEDLGGSVTFPDGLTVLYGPTSSSVDCWGGDISPDLWTTPANFGNTNNQPAANNTKKPLKNFPLDTDNNGPSCSTKLPNGKTIGSYVQQSVRNIEDAAGFADLLGLEKFGAFYGTVQSHGPIDFKNNFGVPDTTGSLGAAGNFAYGAIASGIGYPQSVAEFGAGFYAGTAHKLTPGNPFFEDNSAAQNLPPGYATQGCTKQ